MIEIISIDISNFCSKQCHFCYNGSNKQGSSLWKPREVIDFGMDCVAHGVQAISLGGGEPLEYEGVFEIISALSKACYLTITSNGLPLEEGEVLRKLIEANPDKIHLSIHYPHIVSEVERVARQIKMLQDTAIKPGVNLMVSQDQLVAARNVYAQLRTILSPEQIILIPERFANTPTPREVGLTSGGEPFQSPSCLIKCEAPAHFCSVTWDKLVSYCSFAGGKAPLASLTYEGLCTSLSESQFISCMEN
ncbi:MAG TPA: radical SAM protein [Bacteroidales bacterium]|jgi:organic radical activating enzyme|nr:radical SAM protein [Bacteroidales bacterium]